MPERRHTTEICPSCGTRTLDQEWVKTSDYGGGQEWIRGRSRCSNPKHTEG